MTGLDMMKKAMEQREAAGFKLTWFIPEDNREFTAYAKDEAQKTAWLADAAAKGWELR